MKVPVGRVSASRPQTELRVGNISRHTFADKENTDHYCLNIEHGHYAAFYGRDIDI